jgi:hypothetical protein
VHQQRLLVGQIFREILRQARGRVLLPCEQIAGGVGHAACRNVAEDLRQVLLRVPVEFAKQNLHGARQIHRAGEIHLRHGRLVACEKTGQGTGLHRHGEVGGGARGCRVH